MEQTAPDQEYKVDPMLEEAINRVAVNNVNLAYETFGTGEQDILFIHGFMGRSTGDDYKALYEPLMAEFRITALDIRGHGGSANVIENFTLDQVTDDIITACDKLALDKPLYIGHSMGGLLGLLCALKSPETFSGLVLLAPAAATGAKGAWPEDIEQSLQSHRDQEAMMENLRAIHVRDVTDEALRAGVKTSCLVAPSVQERYLKVEFPAVDVSGRLSEITLPVLSIFGARENVIPLEAQIQTALGLPHCKQVIFPDEGHLLPTEAPERVAREITRFYQDEIAQRADTHS